MAESSRLLHARFRMQFSRQVQYGLSGIFDLAYHGAGEPVRVQSIGERQKIPYRFLEQIFQKLRKAGLVRGKRGPGGGYVLARSPGEISLREVIEAIEGPLGLAAAEEEASEQDSAVLRPRHMMRELAERMAGSLETMTISDLCRDAMKQHVPRDLPDGFDYQI
ncbi:MAG: Rrf2 family transcriptional regulator [Myxococcota bacterium]